MMLSLSNFLLVLFGIVTITLKRKSGNLFYRYYPILLLIWLMIGLSLKFRFLILLGPIFITCFEYKRINNSHISILLISIGIFFEFAIFGIEKSLSLYLISLILISYFISSLYKSILFISIFSLGVIFFNSIMNFTLIKNQFLIYEIFLLYILIGLFINIFIWVTQKTRKFMKL